MTRQDAELLRKVEARIRRLRPDLAAALLRSLDAIRALYTDAEWRAIAEGRVPIALAFSDEKLALALSPFRSAIRNSVQSAVRLTIPDLPVPRRAAPPTLDALFDVLSPRVLEALRETESPALQTLGEQIRGTVEAYVENGLRDGRAPKDVARQLRQTIGIAPHQEKFVQNYERELRSLNSKALGRELTDARFDTAVRKAIKSGTPLTEQQITERVALYRKNFANHNTNVVTRQITVDAYRQGQRLAHQANIDNGFVRAEDLVRTWVKSDAVKDPRPEHERMRGETVPWGQQYSNGDMIPGLGKYGCQCTERVGLRRSGTRVPAATASRTARAAAIGAF